VKVSEKWLREWIDPPLSTEDLATQMTLLGLEVDTIDAVQAEFTGVIVAEVISAVQHPNADSLRICTVSTGGKETLAVVCGAPNARAGLKAPLAIIGACLPDAVNIRESRLRGEVSQGMLCSAGELQLAEDTDGLMELPPDAPVGTPLEEYLDLADSVLDVELTPNRGDCLSIRGLAREIGARNQISLTDHPVAAVAITHQIRQAFTVEEGNACVRYSGRVVRAIDCAAATPVWMAERLRRCGLRSINPAVDSTNYVMLERGQPMHAFDLDKLQGAIQVRKAKSGERLILLDGRDTTLDDDITVIADDRGVIAIAGIMGGLATAVDDKTRNIFFESALFLPAEIAGKPWRLDAHTDSSHRFERGVDPGGQLAALDYATTLLLEHWGGEAGPVDDWISVDGLPGGEASFLRRERVQRYLGNTLDDAAVESILRRLGIDVVSVADGWQLEPPTARFDLCIEEDYIEELARVHGYAHFSRTVGEYRADFQPVAENTLSEDRLKETLVERGYQEVVTFSFVDAALQSQITTDVRPVELSNPISSDLSVMRTSLVTGLLGVMQHNANRQLPDLRVFETGLRYISQGVEIKQEKIIGGLICGRRYAEQWNHSAATCDFFDLKGDVETLFARASGVNWNLQPGTQSFLHPGQSADIVIDEKIAGWIGQLHPQLQKSLDLSQSPVLFEILFDYLTTATVPGHRELSRFPTVRRDLSVVVATDVSIAALERCIRDNAPKWLQDIVVFDLYSGENIESGMKSVALGLILQDFSRTLADSEIDQAVQRITESLNHDFGAELRV